MKTILQAAVLAALAFAPQVYAGTVTLTLNPVGGAISGSAGSTVGWGFDIVNGTGDNLVIDNSYFCEAGEDPVNGPDYTCGADATVGAYTDYIASNLGVISPGETTEDFDGVSQGFGSYTIGDSATVGSTDTGTLVLVYDEYSADFTTEIATNVELTAPASVSVSVATPEPGTSALFGGALLLSGFLARRKHS
jgi:hypothetical protein